MISASICARVGLVDGTCGTAARSLVRAISMTGVPRVRLCMANTVATPGSLEVNVTPEPPPGKPSVVPRNTTPLSGTSLLDGCCINTLSVLEELEQSPLFSVISDRKYSTISSLVFLKRYHFENVDLME